MPNDMQSIMEEFNQMQGGPSLMIILGRILIIAILVTAILGCLVLCVMFIKKIITMLSKKKHV